MSYRKSYNKHQHWLDACHRFSAEIAETTAGESVFNNPACLDEYLLNGDLTNLDKPCKPLSQLTNKQFLALTKLVTYWYLEYVGGEDNLDAYNQQLKVRKFSRFIS